MVTKDGFGALYKGAWPSILRALPSYAVSFWGYEATLSILEKNRIRNMAKTENSILALNGNDIHGNHKP